MRKFAVETEVNEMRKDASKNGISPSDLPNVMTQSYNHLFPLIDTSRYQVKAPQSIYIREELPASQEILNYFERRASQTSEFKDIHGAFPGPPRAPSAEEVLHPSTSDEQKESAEYASSDEKLIVQDHHATYLEQLHSRCLQMRRMEATDKSLMLRRRSMPLEVTESFPYTALPKLPMRPVHPSSIWVGCIIDYMVISRRLNVRLVHTSDMFEDIMDGKLFAKVLLLPGRIQKQKIAVKRLHSKAYQRVNFEKFSGPELHMMAIGVKLMLSRGLFKRPQLLNEWTVPLEHVSLISEHTAWQLFEWGN